MLLSQKPLMLKTLLSVTVPSGCSANIKLLTLNEQSKKHFDLLFLCDAANETVVTLNLYYLCSLSKGCGGKQWPEKILGSKRGSWCKLGIHSSVEFETSFRLPSQGIKN